ncbi:MAG: transporter substrate-binding domain-containing protein [Clostridia bacterium]|nr:transporter substrate-binding domain-containing protein [Clostridia bacterium]
MKKLLTLLLTVLLGITACVSLIGCGKEKKQITVGITNAAPMNYKDASGNWVGFDTELTLAIFEELGYEVMFKEIEWSNKYIELNSGTIDCIWNGFTANSQDKDSSGVLKDRSELVNFSMNYMINEQCVVKNKSVAFVDETSFDGKTIAFENGSSGDTGVGYIEEDYTEISFNKKGMTSQSAALQEVNAGTADFAVVDKSIAENAAGLGYNNIEIVEFDYFSIEYYAIGFAKTDDGAALRDSVNTKLVEKYNSGLIKTLAEKYNIDFTNRVKPCFEK